MNRLLPLLAAAVFVAGCAQPGEPSPAPSELPEGWTVSPEGTPVPPKIEPGPTNKSDFPPLPTILPTKALPLFAIVRSYENPISVLVTENCGASKPVPRELFLRLIDRHGNIHDFTKTIPPLDACAETTLSFDVGQLDPPLLLTNQCGCASTWLFTGRVDAVQGNVSWINTTKETVRVAWGLGPDDTLLPLMEANKTFYLGPDVIHYTYLHGNNANGDVKLFTPSGRELAHWQLRGREETDNGHRSNGAQPLETGEWTLSLKGSGWFELYIEKATIRPEAWNEMGITPPSGEL